MWQDLVFLFGSIVSVIFLFPTLREKASQVPRATSIPSMVIGGIYAFTFFTLNMPFSALGALAACTMWSLIAAFRSPRPGDTRSAPPALETVTRRLTNRELPFTEGIERAHTRSPSGSQAERPAD